VSSSSPSIRYRPLKTLDDFASVVDLERCIWGPGYDDVVPTPILAVTSQRGGILIGAFADERPIGFIYSIAAIKNDMPTQWSHMLGVLPEYRSAGVGHRLKLLQRERALEMGLDLIEWTFDPMQAANAHLNFSKLGVLVEEYEPNVYGTSASPLHAGNPTDRFIAEWLIRSSRVERRVAAGERLAPPSPQSSRSNAAADPRPINRAIAVGEWLDCGDVDLSLEAPHLTVEIPAGFTEMLSRAPDLALAWRMATREIFMTYFARRYRAVEFLLDREARAGRYLLAK
jgi:predicted GNAT superfamily acetyltransferase